MDKTHENQLTLGVKCRCAVSISAPTGEPQNFGITPGDDGPSSRNLTFFWDLPPPTQRNGVITSYTISCSPDTETLPLVETTLPGVGGLTVGGFRPFTEYMCTIAATNSQGSGPPAISTTMTNEDGECMNDSYIAILLLFLLVDSVIP